jgi:mono/diheme cytochrome c family protein
MNYLVAQLSDEYLREISEHYERLSAPYPPPAPAPTPLAARGRALATKGDPARKLPACVSCHGNPPTGMQPAVPGLVGLSSHYIASQMGAWKIGQRHAFEPDCMGEIASILTAEDIAAISAWLAGLPASTSARASAKALRMPMECGSAPRPAVKETPAQLKRGEYLARAGNCFTCHSVRGEAPYAGGVAIHTPFGTVHSSNITPDAETGIGTWSADDFWNALHNGRSKDGSYLYPAFPFPNYTKVTRADADAMYAYFRSVAPVRRANRPHELRFPYNRRSLLLVWRALYFRSGVHQDDPRQSPQWNRGAYLVQGLGHCSACHASRNVLGAVTSDDFSGGLLPAQNWYAPALSSERETSLGKWSLEELALFLKTGISDRAAAYGPMSAVIRHSLQFLSPADAGAMATYLRSQVQRSEERSRSTAQAERLMEHGAHIYERHCASCHRANGEGVAAKYPALAANASILTDLPVNAIRMVYVGGFPPSTAGNPRPFGMPPFYQDLSDYDVAAVVTFIRRSWGNAAAPVAQGEAARLRGVPADF